MSALSQIVFFIISMGQNQSATQMAAYSSQQYFQQQVEFYRWRADPRTNTHICKVQFHLQEEIRDKENLKSLIEHHFITGHYISLNSILNLANQQTGLPREELMDFENYACTLADLEEKLNLEETLYSLHCLFTGYEVLFSKLGKLKISPSYCFVTMEGEVRAWLSADFKSNENASFSVEGDRSCPVIASEMGLIKRVLQMGERLASNPTQFLHFSRQFRSFMERDVLQNWNFTNARKLINSYLYTYRLCLPCNIKEALNKLKRSRVNANITQSNTSLVSQSSFSQPLTKNDLSSTGSHFANPFLQNSQPSNNVKAEVSQRPVSLSDFSSKKSQEMKVNPLRTHTKKFSSTDLKHLHDRGKQVESPKISRSQFVSQWTSHQGGSKRRQFCFMQKSYPDPTMKTRKERELALIDTAEKGINTTQLLSPNENRINCSTSQNSMDYNQRSSKENNNPGILKPNHCFKQKKKLQKKAVAVNKYISFYQEGRNVSKNELSVPELSADAVKELSSEQVSNSGWEGEPVRPKGSLLNFVFPPTEKQFLQKRQMSNGPDYSHSCQVSRKPSFEMTPSNDSQILAFKGRNDHFRQMSKMENQLEGSQPSSQVRDCFTLRTLDKLIDNNEVSELQSNGSFMSIPQSNGSQYHGALSKMGRSVDIMKLPSNKHVPVKKAVATSNHLGNTFHY